MRSVPKAFFPLLVAGVSLAGCGDPQLSAAQADVLDRAETYAGGVEAIGEDDAAALQADADAAYGQADMSSGATAQDYRDQGRALEAQAAQTVDEAASEAAEIRARGEKRIR